MYVLAIYFFKGKVKVFRVFKWPSPTLEEGREEVFRMFESKEERRKKLYIVFRGFKGPSRERKQE